MNKSKQIIRMISLALLTFFCALKIYNLPCSEIIIDYVAFFGGIFIALEAVYRIAVSTKPIWPSQFSRILRIIIGTCVFAIHTLQFMR